MLLPKPDLHNQPPQPHVQQLQVTSLRFTLEAVPLAHHLATLSPWRN